METKKLHPLRYCQKCGKSELEIKVDAHHVYPRRRYKQRKCWQWMHKQTVYLCEECHRTNPNSIEKILADMENSVRGTIPAKVYRTITEAYLA